MEFLGMLVRWLHVIAGVAWIGSSFYFIWLDNSLEAPAPGSENAQKGVSGELWAVHGGGFYNPQKYAVAPAALPEKLHWFKWEAYTTWLSGTALLVLVYWLHAQTMMVDATRADLTGWQAVGIGAASMVVSWFVYDALCRSPLGQRDGALGAVVFLLLGGLTWTLCHWLGGRAAYIPCRHIDRHDYGGERVFHHHTWAKENGGSDARRAVARSDLWQARQAAQRAQQLLHVAGHFYHDQQPLRGDVWARAELGRANFDLGGGSFDPALF